jgi:hypothetical protein
VIATHEIMVKIADRLEASHPQEAMKLRFCASQVQYLEGIVNEQIAEAIELLGTQPPKRPYARKAPRPELANGGSPLGTGHEVDAA